MTGVSEILKRPYARVVIPELDGTFRAEVVEFPGCIASGDTASEALECLEEIAASWLEATLAKDQSVPEPIEKYPEATMFGELPAFGFFVRHVDGLVLRNIRIYQTKPDARPPFVFDNVKNLDR